METETRTATEAHELVANTFLHRRHRSVGGGARGHRALLRQRPAGHRDGVRDRPAPVARFQKHDGRAARSSHQASHSPRRGRDAGGGRPRLSQFAEERDDHLGRTPPAERAGPATRAHLAHRPVLPLARARLRAARGRRRDVGWRQRRIARHSRHSPGRRSRDRPGRRQRSVRRDAEDCGRFGRRPMGPGSPGHATRPRRTCRGPDAESAGPGWLRAGDGGRQTMAWKRCTRCSRRSSASTSPTTSRAP